MEPEGSLPQLHVPAICPYPEPARYRPYPHIPPPEDQSYLPIYAWIFQVGSFPHVFPPKHCIRLSSPLRLLHIPPYLILPDLITLAILGEECRS